jgi:glycosyltransferase involved in cell wall biosynthesis
MKILTITAHYPPCHSGGYELRVKNIMDGLTELGHQILVLTNHPENTCQSDVTQPKYQVKRKLHNRLKARFFPKELLFDLLDAALLEKQIKEFQPDVVYLGHTYILSKTILPYLATVKIPLVYDEGGSGLIEAWTEHGRWFRFCGMYRSRFAVLNWFKPLMIKLISWLGRGRINQKWSWPKNMKIIFNSELNRRNAQRNGVPVENSVVIHSGIDTKLFTFKPREKFGTPLRIITPGRLERRKGQLDAVALVNKLVAEGIDTHLILAGSGWVDGYLQEVNTAIQTHGLTDKISIFPMLTPEELVSHYHQADICFFSSFQNVGFSRVPLEAMACGSLVISYGNEGSDEVIRDQENGYIVKEGDLESIVKNIWDLIKLKGLVGKIQDEARIDIERSFKINDYILNIENILLPFNSEK